MGRPGASRSPWKEPPPGDEPRTDMVSEDEEEELEVESESSNLMLAVQLLLM